MRSKTWTLKAAGIPAAKPRPRVTRWGTYTPKNERYKEWEKNLTEQLEALKPPRSKLLPISQPCQVELQFMFPRPIRLKTKSAPGGLVPHQVRPDLDNLVKMVLDTMQTTGWISDDKIVARIAAEKVYAAMEALPGVHIMLTALL